MDTQAMTIRLPQELYELLRREAFEKRVSQASIVIGALAQRLGRDGVSRAHPGWSYPDGYTDELAGRLVRAAKELHVREIDNPPAYLGAALAVSDMVHDLDAALRDRAPLPKRWESQNGAQDQ